MTTHKGSLHKSQQQGKYLERETLSLEGQPLSSYSDRKDLVGRGLLQWEGEQGAAAAGLALRPK